MPFAHCIFHQYSSLPGDESIQNLSLRSMKAKPASAVSTSTLMENGARAFGKIFTHARQAARRDSNLRAAHLPALQEKVGSCGALAHRRFCCPFFRHRERIHPVQPQREHFAEDEPEQPGPHVRSLSAQRDPFPCFHNPGCPPPAHASTQAIHLEPVNRERHQPHGQENFKHTRGLSACNQVQCLVRRLAPCRYGTASRRRAVLARRATEKRLQRKEITESRDCREQRLRSRAVSARRSGGCAPCQHGTPPQKMHTCTSPGRAAPLSPAGTI